MQLKKKELQMTIQTTALEIFYQQGYTKTKMSDIAKEMGISVGNIYTYFKNKTDLFYTVLPEETVSYLEEAIYSTIRTYNDFLVEQKESEEVCNLIGSQMELISSRYREVVIMLDKNEGTRYEGLRDKIINEMTEDRLIKGRFFDETLKMTEYEISLFYRIIGHGFLEMILRALKENMCSEEERYQLCMSLIKYQLKKRLT
ncbi:MULTISPECIES: TetR/AcrR family transcriptional regulator [Vagococcus]|uniref:TetR/AcrR family transcriptional regulator n=1 Tax=Vagococcus TaxID=2737 RepID=UPI002FCBF0DE